MFINYLFISGLNCVTESAGKELMLAQITEIQEDSESLEKTQTVKQKLKNIQVKEVLLRRFVALKENMQAIHADKENLQNECDQKDTQIESLNLELTEVKQAIQSFLSGNLTLKLKSMSNIVKTSATPEIVPKQSEKVQRAQISHSNDGEEQINELMPDQQAVQTPDSDSQLQIIPQSEEQEQQQEVTQLESTIAPPMPTSPNQIPSQSFVESSPKNISSEGSLLEILATPGTSGISGLQSSLAKNDSQKIVLLRRFALKKNRL